MHLTLEFVSLSVLVKYLLFTLLDYHSRTISLIVCIEHEMGHLSVGQKENPVGRLDTHPRIWS